MNRMLILAAAAALIALPASAQSIRVSTAGKSPDQVREEVNKAAYKLCGQAVVGATFRTDELRACVAQTTRATFAQTSDPSLKLAQR
ncbi:hypothetical protein [Phenylobacterium sp.]|uniref:hypothetical protein n=1 Tax=Phenylobacterium sp. TaxID=1871053 RepID=UPI0035691305